MNWWGSGRDEKNRLYRWTGCEEIASYWRRKHKENLYTCSTVAMSLHSGEKCGFIAVQSLSGGGES